MAKYAASQDVFDLTDDFSQRGYVSKPTAGFCGLNISLFDKNDNLLKETSGRFDVQDQVYRELWKLPEINGFRTQIGTFSSQGRTSLL